VSDEGEYRLWSLLGALQDDGLNPDRLPSAPAHLRRDSNAFFLPIASYAQIPAANTQVFLSQVDAWEKQFIFVSKLDAGRRQFKAAINEVKTTIKRLVRALEYLDKLQYGSFIRGHSRSSPKARLLLVDPGWGETARHKNKWNQLRIVRARLRSRLGRIALSPSACTPTKGISRSINGAAGGQRQPLISAAQFDLASRLVDDHKQARDRWRFRVRRSLCSRPARTTQEQAAALLNYQTEYLAEKSHGTAN
jgi:hypothetical protein